MLPTDIRLLRSTITGCSSSASHMICTLLGICPALHIIWVLSMMNAEEMYRRSFFTVFTISSLVAWFSAMWAA